MNQTLAVYFLEKGFVVDYESTDSKDFYENDTLYTAFHEDVYKALFVFGFTASEMEMPSTLLYLHKIAKRFIDSLAQNPDVEFTRKADDISVDCLRELLQVVPFGVGAEFINQSWVSHVWHELSVVFSNEIQPYNGTVASFLIAHNAAIRVVGRVFFHLVENKDDDFPFAFLATYSTESADHKQATHLPLKNALIEYKDQDDRLLNLLGTVSKAADSSDFISELVESGELFSPLKFTAEEAYIFLKEIALYEQCGILCRIPNWWKQKTNSLKLSVTVGDKSPSKLGLDALLSFRADLYFGEEKITKEEIEALLAQSSGLSFIKGKWVEVDPDQLKLALEAYEKANALAEQEDMTLAEAMRAELQIGQTLGIDNDQIGVEVSSGDWLRTIKSRLLHPAEIENLDAGEDFKAVLRAYQQTGFDWLALMKSLGFGALLADDMGLGKTVQILALLEYMRGKGTAKTLLVLPASLLSNWQKELDKFAPKLTYTILHANKTQLDLQSADLFITTYGMAVKLPSLMEQHWDLLILDEAQAIKNPSTKQTKAIKQLRASAKIAMTGTPVENRLSDLWSIFDFINTGLLGTAKEFTNFSKQLKDNDDAYTKLRDVVSPFILRRLKTDKTVISDLPEKLELKCYTSLCKKQVVLYQSLVKSLESQLADAEGISRKGLVLASIMKFKQICNHPDQYLGQTAFSPDHSGKFTKLAEICETIRDKHERVLVFTQFKEMTRPIAEYLETVFGRSGLVLHGGTPVNKRGDLVNQFNGETYVPFMVLSLKAGGVGLNLTAANHVIHFDRWWNPAIENQATDRVFRIGQQKNVMVHKFITSGTIEEKIDQMLNEKQQLATDIIASSGEKWITEMSNDDLINLFTLL